jgi:hypothetical protein
LRESITGDTALSELQFHCWEFYVAYLDLRIARIWAVVILPIAVSLVQGTGSNSEAMRLVFNMLIDVTLFLQKLGMDADSSLFDLWTWLAERHHIQNASEQLGIQMCFHFVGWLTGLFDPSDEFVPHFLTLRGENEESARRQIFRRPAVRCTRVDIDAGRQPLHRLLRAFGSILPELEKTNRSFPERDLEVGSDSINTAYISLRNMRQALKLRIEWVNTLNQHLEFDQRNNILRVFRLPSLVRLLYRRKGETILNRLFVEDGRDRPADEVQTCPDVRSLLAEVILSSRLIFRDSARSWMTLTCILGKRYDKLIKDVQEDSDDPLLNVLRLADEKSTELQELYNGLEEGELRDIISASFFPTIGPRLLMLQRLSILQNPRSLINLWNDSGSWYALWAAVTFGGGALILGVVQLVIQIWQTH